MHQIKKGTMKNKKPIKIVHCGCCECYHRIDFRGDCREDSERFASYEDAEERLGPVEEIDENSPEAEAGFPVIGVGFYVGAGIPKKRANPYPSGLNLAGWGGLL